MAFEKTCTLPMVKVRNRNGRPFKNGLDALIELVRKRIDLDSVFDSRKVLRELVDLSGGNVRDLMRLIDNAQLAARVQGKNRIDMAAAKRAALDIQLDYERLLVPGRTYFLLLAEIHRTKGDGAPTPDKPDPEEVASYQSFFTQFLFNGSVLEYNGDDSWYDVHPVIRNSKAFQKALQDAQGPTQIPEARG
jgi:hypothetical protein